MSEPDQKPLTVEELQQWVTAGASWRPVLITDARAVVDMCQCTGALEERRETADAETIAYLRAHADEQD